MNKRQFLRFIGAGSVTAVLEGCANTPGLQRLVSGDPIHTSGPLPMSQEDVAASTQAKKIFEAFRQTGRVPTAETQQLQSAIDNWNAVSRRFQYTQTIAIEDAQPLVQAMAPALRLSNNALTGRNGRRA